MVGSSKILTVSYGTFSCTLEGFDDSFSTMKAIAEYFRDLAADDRYFGAEPPTPDADMLARIAEREISRRVEARTDDSGIVLRAASALAAPAAEPTQVDEEPADFVAPEPQMETAVPPAAPVAQSPAMPPVASPPAEAATPDADVAQQVAQAERIVAENIAQEAASAPAPLADILSDEDTDQGETLTFEDMAPTPAAEVPAHPDAESVAAKLQRIRAVVGNAPAQDAQPQFAEDQHARDLAQAADMTADAPMQEAFEADVDDADEQVLPEVVVTEPASDVADQAEDTLPAGEEVMEAAVTPDADSAADVAPEADVEVEPEAEAEAEPEAEAQAEPEAEAEAEPGVEAEADDTDDVLSNVAASAAKPTVRARIVRLRKDRLTVEPVTDVTDSDDAETAVADEDLVAQVLGDDTQSFADIAEDLSDDVADDFAAEATDETTEDDLPEVETTEADADTVETDDDMAEAAPSIAALDGADELMGSEDTGDHAQSDLSPEDEADLQDELAQVEREIAETKPERQGRHILPEPDDAAMSRIMSQTDEALSEPEGSRRRNAIAQLKAAVAATEAARQLGDRSTEKAKAETAFREDLDQVVNPERPARPVRPQKPDESRTARPRPAPLKLVASQRVDAPQEAAKPAMPETPVQPRRVAMAAEAAIQTDASSFAEFAEEMGATELPDLLEAAAAYTAFVEGVEDFSRPQIMKKVQLTTDETFSREDGLRSFGTLLRQGRISKVRNGRFQVSEQTRFRPEQRAG